jgi:phospholipase/carboxylesterase
MPGFALTHRSYPARSGQRPHPAVILLHGLGSNELDLLNLAPSLDPRIFVISVRAPFDYQWGGYMWYDLEQHGGALGGESINTSLELLRRFLDEAVNTYPIDPSALFAGGFSMGAAMAGAIALLEPDRVAGAIMASGYLPPDPMHEYRSQEAAGRPFFQAHGTLDQVVPITLGHATRAALEQTPVNLTYREYPIGHEVSPNELADISAWFASILDAHESWTAGTLSE